jgi:hypothetical protein
MILNPEQIGRREKQILAGLYLSKYDSLGLKKLGFDSFAEAFNVMGYALGSRPASLKNYRDEFDPLMPNRRKGWHKRELREYCAKILNEYKNLDLQSFTALIKSFLGFNENDVSPFRTSRKSGKSDSAFANRLITGLAAERYFESVQPKLAEFKEYSVENTTRIGCGYDFRLHAQRPIDFLAVEVKGMKDRTGTLSLTPKEHGVAKELRERFFLFVVKNFREKPYHEIYPNPLSGGLRFKKTENVIVQVSWCVSV